MDFYYPYRLMAPDDDDYDDYDDDDYDDYYDDEISSVTIDLNESYSAYSRSDFYFTPEVSGMYAFAVTSDDYTDTYLYGKY